MATKRSKSGGKKLLKGKAAAMSNARFKAKMAREADRAAGIETRDT